MKKTLKLFNHSGKICKRCHCGRAEQVEKTNEQKLVDKWEKTGLLDEFKINEEKYFIVQLLENQAVQIIKSGGDFDQTINSIQLPATVRIARELINLLKEHKKPLKAMDLPAMKHEEHSFTAHTKLTSARFVKLDFSCTLDAEVQICAEIAENILKVYKKAIIEENKAVFPYTILIPMKISENEYGFATRFGENK